MVPVYFPTSFSPTFFFFNHLHFSFLKISITTADQSNFETIFLNVIQKKTHKLLNTNKYNFIIKNQGTNFPLQVIFLICPLTPDNPAFKLHTTIVKYHNITLFKFHNNYTIANKLITGKLSCRSWAGNDSATLHCSLVACWGEVDWKEVEMKMAWSAV